MATKIVISPGKYIQGPGEMKKIATYAKDYGQQAFIIADAFVMNMTTATIAESFANSAINYTAAEFKGECSKPEISRLQQLAQDSQSDLIIGIGGGKTLDTAKAIAFHMKKPVMIVPTIASTDGH